MRSAILNSTKYRRILDKKRGQAGYTCPLDAERMVSCLIFSLSTLIKIYVESGSKKLNIFYY